MERALAAALAADVESRAGHDSGDEDRGADAYCRNCGDPFDADAQNAAMRAPHGAWRPCPKPSPGVPLVDCGIGGHMYDDAKPRFT